MAVKRAGEGVIYEVGLAESLAAALAKENKAELVTGDPKLNPLEKEIRINWLK